MDICPYILDSCFLFLACSACRIIWIYGHIVAYDMVILKSFSSLLDKVY